MSRSAWYIGCSEDEVGEAAILVGDRGRIDRIAEHLDSPHFVEENRGLRTVTGSRAGRRVTVSAFGMGGPIAAIVLHELFDLGVRRFLRIGTAMVMPPAKLGDFVLADGAVRGEGTSLTYAPIAYPAVADFDLGVALRAVLAKRGASWRAGLFGTYDGFYTEMFALSAGEKQMIDGLREEIRRLGLIATDMETATLLTAGRVLGAQAASLCLGTVDGLTQEKISPDAMAARERDMFEIALDAIVAAPSNELSGA
ncbi:MAG: nucleoside phosphorylase [Hyphomicrobiales bacterium]|nr:nucleoside phosphorylase [Hyphomicrobiales bacterium]